MISQHREYLRQPQELSLGHDPDLIARYLDGEDVTEQLRAMELGAPNAQEEDRRPSSHDRVPRHAAGKRRTASPPPVIPAPSQPRSVQQDKLGIDQYEPTRLDQQAPLRAPRGHQHGPRWSLIAVAIAIGATLALSLWITYL